MSVKLVTIYWSNYDSGVSKTLVRGLLQVDTLADLPGPDDITGYRLTIGTEADIIDTAARYKMDSSGTWYVQEQGTDFYTKAEIDTILQNMSMSSVGGTGKYISEITQSNGVINAVPGTIDSEPIAASQNPVRSGGVVNYVYGTPPINISDNTDLDDLYTPGCYKCTSGGTAGPPPTGAQSLINCPTTSSFRLEVKSTIASAGTGYQIQLIYPNNSNGEMFMRRRLSAGSGNWGPWFKFQGTQV